MHQNLTGLTLLLIAVVLVGESYKRQVTEEALMWETPLARVLAWYHVSQSLREDVWTVAPRSPGEREQARGAAELSAVMAAARDEAAAAEEDVLPEWLRSLTGAGERGDDGGLDL